MQCYNETEGCSSSANLHLEPRNFWLAEHAVVANLGNISTNLEFFWSRSSLKTLGSGVATGEFSKFEEVRTVVKSKDLFLEIDAEVTGVLEIWYKSDHSKMLRQHCSEPRDFQ